MNKKKVDELIDTLKNGDRSNILYVTEELIKLGKNITLPLLNLLNSEENKAANLIAAKILGEIEDKRAIKPLINAIARDYNYINHRRLYAEALVKLGKSSVKPLIEALKDKNPLIRESASFALGKIGDKRAVLPLIKAINDPNELVCISIVNALAQLADERALPILIKVNQKNTNETFWTNKIKEASSTAIERLKNYQLNK